MRAAAGDIASLYVRPSSSPGGPTSIFLLASVVSGEAETDFDMGYAINLDGTRMIFEAMRREHRAIRRRYKPARSVHLLDRRVRRAVPRNNRRRILSRRR